MANVAQKYKYDLGSLPTDLDGEKARGLFVPQFDGPVTYTSSDVAEAAGVSRELLYTHIHRHGAKIDTVESVALYLADRADYPRRDLIHQSFIYGRELGEKYDPFDLLAVTRFLAAWGTARFRKELKREFLRKPGDSKKE